MMKTIKERCKGTVLAGAVCTKAWKVPYGVGPVMCYVVRLATGADATYGVSTHPTARGAWAEAFQREDAGHFADEVRS